MDGKHQFSPQQISKYERGTDQTSPSRLVELSMIFDCHVAELFEGITEALEGPQVTRGDVEAMSTYKELPEPVQERLRELMRAMTTYCAAGLSINNVLGKEPENGRTV